MKHVKLRDCNWIHLDLKGAVPSFEALMNQLQYIRDYGYTGIIFEYEDRLKWKNWPELARQPFSRNEHRKLLEYCHDLGLETVPLIQTLGHLEWILKHEEYCHLRENNSVSELCPSVSGVREKLCRRFCLVTSLDSAESVQRQVPMGNTPFIWSIWEKFAVSF